MNKIICWRYFASARFFLITLNLSVVMRRISSSIYICPLAIWFDTTLILSLYTIWNRRRSSNSCPRSSGRRRKLLCALSMTTAIPISFWLRLLTSGFSYYYYRIITNLFQKKKMTQFSDWIFVTKSLELIFFSSQEFILIILSIMLCAQHFAELEPSSTDEIQQ